MTRSLSFPQYLNVNTRSDVFSVVLLLGHGGKLPKCENSAVLGKGCGEQKERKEEKKKEEWFWKGLEFLFGSSCFPLAGSFSCSSLQEERQFAL